VRARPAREDLENEQIEGALERIKLWHIKTSWYIDVLALVKVPAPQRTTLRPIFRGAE
jgi:hypothetical protein